MQNIVNKWPDFAKTKQSLTVQSLTVLTVGSGKKWQHKTAVSISIGRARFCFGTTSEDLFGVFGVATRRDVGEAYVLPLPNVLVAHLSLQVEAHHQLVDGHANNGAQERCKNGHQEPAISSSGTLNGKN